MCQRCRSSEFGSQSLNATGSDMKLYDYFRSSAAYRVRIALNLKGAGQSGEARIFLIQDDNLTAEVPLRRSILQSTLRQKYRSTGRHNPQRDGGPEKGLYRLHPIALGCLERQPTSR